MTEALSLTRDLLFALVLVWAIWSNRRGGDSSLLRCAIAAAIQAVGIYAWRWATDCWSQQPFMAHFISLLAMFVVVVRAPAAKWNAVIGGILMFGILISAVYGARYFMLGFSYSSDWTYWFGLHVMEWACLLAFAGWTYERPLRRLADFFRRAGSRLVRSANRGSVAR